MICFKIHICWEPRLTGVGGTAAHDLVLNSEGLPSEHVRFAFCYKKLSAAVTPALRQAGRGSAVNYDLENYPARVHTRHFQKRLFHASGAK